MNEIRFFCAGIPSPGGSKTGFAIKKGGIYTGRVAIVDAGGKKTKEWRQAVAAAAFQAMKTADAVPLTGGIEMELIFQMPRPKSHYRSDGVSLRPGSPSQHITRPDVLKLARAVEDSLTGICYLDDAQIVKEALEKAFSDVPGCWVVVREVEG